MWSHCRASSIKSPKLVRTSVLGEWFIEFAAADSWVYSLPYAKALSTVIMPLVTEPSFVSVLISCCLQGNRLLGESFRQPFDIPGSFISH